MVLCRSVYNDPSIALKGLVSLTMLPVFRFLQHLIEKNLLIIFILNLAIVSIHEEGYCRNASCTLNLISTGVFVCDRVKKKYT
jgi:hypothetical protein